MTERMPSRRALLRYCAAGSIVGLAGCQGNSDDAGGDGADDGNETDNTGADDSNETDNTGADDSGTSSGGEPTNYAAEFGLAGDGASRFRNWLVPGNQRGTQGGVTSVCAYRNFETAADQGIESIQTYRSNVAGTLGVDPELLAGQLLVGPPEGQGERQILLGEFDVNAVSDALSDTGELSAVDEYRGYSVFETEGEDRVAVGPDAVLSVENFQEFIDANQGDGELLGTADPDVGHLFDVLPTGIQTSISRHENLDDLAINGSVRHDLDENGNPNHVTRAFVFHEAGDATVERAREIISIGETGYEEILNEQQHARMVMTEFIQDWPG